MGWQKLLLGSDFDESLYALLAGRSGGQLLKGGDAASEHLTLQSTAHATRGYVRAQDDVQLLSNVVRGSDGQARLALAATSPHLKLDDYVRIDERLGVNVDPVGDALIKAQGTLLGGGTGLFLTPRVTGAGAPGYGVQGYIYGQHSSGSVDLYGLDFVAQPQSQHAPYAEVTAVKGLVYYQSAYNCDAAYGFKGQIYNFEYGGVLTTAYGLFFQVVGSGCTDAIGLKVLDVAGATGKNYIAEFGGDTPNMRILGGAPAANLSQLWLAVNNGAVVLRQVQIGAANSGGTNYRMLRVLN